MKLVVLRYITLAGACLLVVAGCSTEAPSHSPEQAGKPLNSAQVAGRITLANAAAIVGADEVHAEQMQALNRELQRSLKLADPGRPVERESARAAARSVEGVRSVVWLDQHNLFAIVEQNAHRSYAVIDAVCLELEPLGDTLGVVVNLQSGAARTGDELEILSRNCQLAPGERAMLQPNRQVDVIDPAFRRIHQTNQRR